MKASHILDESDILTLLSFATAAGQGSDALDVNAEGARLRLLRTLFKRCSDKLPSVRAKALASIATAFQHEPTALQVMQQQLIRYIRYIRYSCCWRCR